MNDTAFQFHFDDQQISAEPGQTVAAALIAGGHLWWRRTRVHDRPRGLFCGIGVCFDCLVTINDRPNRRACLVEAQPGDQVSTQLGAGRAHLAN